MSDNGKPKFAMYWAASCGGCEIAVLNIHEKILDVDANFEVVFWPVAMDAKYKDVEAMEDGSITLLTSSTAASATTRTSTSPNCCAGNPRSWSPSARAPAKAASPAWPTSQPSRRSSTRPSHTITTDNPENIRPQPHYADARRRDHTSRPSTRCCKTLDQVVDVDYYMPGCPPESHQIAAVIDLVIAGPARQGRTASQGRDHRRRQLHRLRRMPAQAQRQDDQGIRPHPADPCRPGTVPAGTGHPLQRSRHPQRLQCPLPNAPAPSASAATVPPKAWWITAPA